MDIKIQIIIAVGVLIAMCVIVNMIRKKNLELRHALTWLAVGMSILILDCFPQLITWISRKLGIASPVNMLFFFGFCFSLVIVFSLTIAMSRMSIRMKQLTQEMALLSTKEIKEDEKNGVEE